MKLRLLALSCSTPAVSNAFVFSVPPQTRSLAATTTALNNYATKWSPSGAAAAVVTAGEEAHNGYACTSPSTGAAATVTARGGARNSYARTKWSPSSGAALYATDTPPPSSWSPSSDAVYDAVRAELALLMDNPSWDDGSLAPLFLRLAWHSSGTYDAATGTGGSNGAGMRFANEAADPENAGLNAARAFLEPVKRKYPAVSYSDLWILAAYVGLAHTGGPVLEFKGGRVDHPDDSYFENHMEYGRLPAAEKYCCPHLDDSNVEASLDGSGRVTGWEGLCDHVRNEVFYRMGFDDREIVALLCGGHVYGRCHPTASGYAGPWVEDMTQFSNEYASDMIDDEWTLVGHGDTWLDAQGAEELRPAPGNRQFVNQVQGVVDDKPPNQMILLSDMILAWDADFRVHLEAYAEDEARLKSDFGAAFKKLTELGCNVPKCPMHLAGNFGVVDNEGDWMT